MDYTVVWLDSNYDHSNVNYQNEAMQLRRIIDSHEIFTDVNECIKFLTQLDATKNVFMIISKDLSENIINQVQNISQVKSMYIHDNNYLNDGLLMQQHKKVKGIFSQSRNIYHLLNHEIRQYENCLPNVNCISLTNSSNELDQSFMYSQLLKETFLKIQDENPTEEMKELLKFLREVYANNAPQLESIREFEEQYTSSSSIKYYTKEYFIYKILNEALRTQNIDIILKFGFFIRDLHRQIVGLHSTSTDSKPLITYRGQGMSNTDFDKLKKSKGGLLAFNNFLSTTADEIVSRMYVETNIQANDMIGILFEIEIDRSIKCSSFAFLKNHSYYEEEKELLFSMNTVFRIGDMNKLGDRMWKVKLTLTNDTDEQLKDVTNSFRDKMKQGTGWQQLGKLMIMLDRYDKAEEIYSESKNFVNTNDWKVFALLFNQLGFIHVTKGKYSTALLFFLKTLEIEKDFLSPDLDLAITYNNIAAAYHSMKNYSDALTYYEKARCIRQLHLRSNDPLLAATYNNIALLYKSMGDYQKARLTCQKAMEIAEEGSIPNHPELATIYGNLATIYTFSCEYSIAFSYYSKALDINEKIFPPNHTSLLVNYINIIVTYTSMGKYSEAISLYEKKLDDPLTQLVEKHPSLAIAYSNIGLAYLEQGNYSLALSYCEKALNIQMKNSSDHNLDLATTYSAIGHIHEAKKELKQALSFYKKTQEIEERCLLPNDPNLATTYNDLGNLYLELNKCPEAYTYLEKALTIRGQFGDDHPSLASVYNNFGNYYKEIKDYDAAISSYEKAQSINEKSVDSNYQNLAINYNNIGNLLYIKRDYSKALEFFQIALTIEQKYLGDKHPDLAYTHNNFAHVLEALERYKEAFNHLKEGIDILDRNNFGPNETLRQILSDHLQKLKQKLQLNKYQII